MEKDINGFAFINSNYGSHGVGILVRNNIKQFTVKEISNKEDIFINRVLHLQIETEEILDIINIYAPVNEENQIKPGFFQKLKEHLNKYNYQTTILTGDFNFVTNDQDRNKGMYKFDKKKK